MARFYAGDLDDATQFRIAIGQRAVGVGGTSCNAQLQYATNGATQTAWADAAATANGGNCSLIGGTANVVRVGAWANLAAGAKTADVFARLAIVTVGTVTTAPTISWAAALFR